MRFCFVATSRGSHFMTELLAALSTAAQAAGHRVEIVFDAFPKCDDERIYLVIPHEFRAWGDRDGAPSVPQRERTIALCTENPGTPWFEETFELVPLFAAAVSINRASAAELQKRGIHCEHLQLGYAPDWDSWRGAEEMQRNIDVLYLGAADVRRDPLLGDIGRDLWSRNCQFLIPPLEPRTRPRPDFLTGADKYHRLRSAKILLNLHRTTSSALEWMRFLEAICNGCVIVSEPCLDSEPLVAGEHFLSTPVDDIAATVERLLEDPASLALIRRRAYDFVRSQLPMEPAGRRLAELAAELPRLPPTGSAAWDAPSSPRAHKMTASLETSGADETSPAHEPQHVVEPAPVRDSHLVEAAGPAQLAYAAQGRLAHIRDRVLRGPRRGVRAFVTTPGHTRTRPRVTVTMVIGPHDGREAVDALESVAAAALDAVELLVLVDPSAEGLVAIVSVFLDEHPSLAAKLIRQPIHRGLAHARNILGEQARSEYLFNLDVSGRIFPATLQRLVDALDPDPQSTFAYPMVAVYEGDRPVELASSLPWEPERLARGNWIDGIVIIRRSRLLALGGYLTDSRLAGWEDFELWCRCAQAGGHGVHVPQVLAWRQRTVSSAAADGEDDTLAKWELMRERFPQLLAPASDG